MISIEPSGEVHLCICPLENDGKNQLTFSDRRTQNNYFNTRIIKSTSNYTYIRQDESVSVDIPIDQIINCNYLFYRNNRFTDRYYYCFITDMKYLSENSTLISFTTDVFQTWQFDINYKRCFVEREHVNNDTIGIHTVPEGLETGEYIVNETYSNVDFSDLCIVVAYSEKIDVTITNSRRLYGGILSGLFYRAFNNTSEGVNSFNDFINNYDDAGKSDAIISVFMLPKKLCGIVEGTIDKPITSSDAPDTFDIEYSKETVVNGYTPKNKKVLTFPYNYLLVSNNSGASNIYQYELFNSDKCKFEVSASITPGGSVRLVPYNYKYATKNENESLPGGKYPICNWNSDVYTNWLTQNGVNIGLDVTSKLIGTGVSAATGNVLGTAGGLLSIASTLASVYQHSLIPDTIKGNINCGDVVSGDKRNTFLFYKMSIKAEYAKIIDDYFSMFGYKVNSLKKPNITGRRNWNYVKTIDANFDGAFPQTDMQKIKNMFNSGITLWHNPTTIYDYSQDNSII